MWHGVCKGIDHPGHECSPSALFETGSFIPCPLPPHVPKAAGLWAFRDSPASAFYLATGTLGLQMCSPTSGFIWAVWLWTHVLTFNSASVSPLSHPPSSRMNFFSSDIFIIDRKVTCVQTSSCFLTTHVCIPLLLWKILVEKYITFILPIWWFYQIHGDIDIKYVNKCQLYHDNCNILRLPFRKEFYLEKFFSHGGF